jgi:hypothetical protein
MTAKSFAHALVVASLCACTAHDAAASCDAVIGRWNWFVGGEVTVSPEGRFVQQSGNGGTWECTDSARGVVVFRWQDGGFVNQLVLSSDGNRLASADPAQSYVSATKVGAAPPPGNTGAPIRPVADSPTLAIQTQGADALPESLPQLLHAVAREARALKSDAIPVALEFEYREAPNPSMRGPAVRILLLSPSAGTGIQAMVTADGLRMTEVDRAVTWGTSAIPSIFLDLPAAVGVARANGLQSAVRSANLRVWSPPGAPAVLAWMIGDKTVDAATGQLIGFDVTGYVDRYNAEWQRAAQSLSRLVESTRPKEEPYRYEDPWAAAAAGYCASISVPTGGEREGMLPGLVCR